MTNSTQSMDPNSNITDSTIVESDNSGSELNINEPHGLVLYIDGSFRDSRAGWGIHGYLYVNNPLKQGIGINQLPTQSGYESVTPPESVTVIQYIDAYGPTLYGHTNNVGELEALLNAFRFVDRYPSLPVTILGDSEYTLKGYDKGIENWPKRDWVTTKGTPVENKQIWLLLLEYKQKYKKRAAPITMKKVDAHSGNVGNDYADLNARTASGGVTKTIEYFSNPTKYHKPEVVVNPLFIRSRLLFNIGKAITRSDSDDFFYYQYHLGRMSTFGHKQDDTTEDRYDKSDLLLGRRIADATFSVVRTNGPDPYLEKIINIHRQEYDTDIIELGIARLDNLYRAEVYRRLNNIGIYCVNTVKGSKAIVTPNNDLLTKTLSPPLLAYDAVERFVIMHNLLRTYHDTEVNKGVSLIDITDALYVEEVEKKKSVVKLRKEITTTTPLIEIPVRFKDNDVVIKPVLGIDIPQRNALAKLADAQTKVTLLVVANGPVCYSFATVFKTVHGDAIYQSPYSQFVLSKKT